MLSTTNEKIITFYKNHPSISFEQSNLFLIELLEKFTDDDNVSIKIISQMMERLKSMEENLQRQEGAMSLKMLEMKDRYMEDIKMILSNNVSEKFSPLLQNYNQQLLDKTQILFQTLPDKIKELQNFIESETKNQLHQQTMVQSLNQSQIDLSQIEQRFAQTQREIEAGFKQVADISTQNQQSVTELLGKMNNSSYKGKISENLLFSILQNLYPSANVEFVGTTKETGDFILERKNKPRILIENKDYSRSVPSEEIYKFIRDCEIQKCSGLFISNSGICGKDSYEVQVNDGEVLVYIQFCNNDSDKVKIGIDIIDHFKEMLDNLNKDDNEEISKEVVKEINDEYKLWASNRATMLKTIKEFHESMKKQLDAMSIPSLEKYLSTRFSPVSTGTTMMHCEHCGYSCKNRQALSAHRRGCLKLKSKNDA
jgi:hypothetical protein